MLEGVIIASVINILFNVVIFIICLNTFKRYKDLGEHIVDYDLHCIKSRKKYKKNLYSIIFNFNNQRQFMVISQNTYERLKIKEDKHVAVFAREYAKRIYSPSFEKYDFSFEKIDWNQKDYKECLSFLICSVIVFEFLIITIGFQL